MCPVLNQELLAWLGWVVADMLNDRFAALPVSSMLDKLESQTKDIEGEVDKLGQRLLYLETTHKNSREHIEQMLRKG